MNYQSVVELFHENQRPVKRNSRKLCKFFGLRGTPYESTIG